MPGKQYVIKHGTKQLFGRVSAIRHRIDINTLEQVPAATFALNEIGRCEFTLSEPMPFDAYADNRETGAFIVIDRINNRTIGAGMICPPSGTRAKDHWDERRTANCSERHSPVTALEREQRLGQRPVTVLLTGLSKTGKTAIANAVERHLFDMGRLATVLDGQDFRLGMSRDLGLHGVGPIREHAPRRRSGEADQRRRSDLSHRVRRAARAGTCSRARDVIGADRFLEIYLHAPLDVLKSRDKEGMYAAAERGELPSFPGVTSEFEEPTARRSVARHRSARNRCVRAAHHRIAAPARRHSDRLA